MGKTSEHTPGPWRIDDDPYHIIAAYNGDWSDFWSVATATGDCGPGKSRTAANARLISAAPDLLEALEVALPFIRTSDAVLQLARAAIAKARGE